MERGQVKAVALHFKPGKGTNATFGFEVYPNTPNPFIAFTNIGFYLPETSEVSLVVFDEAGREVYCAKDSFAKGYGRFLVRGINATGVLYYRMEAPGASVSGKMIHLAD